MAAPNKPPAPGQYYEGSPEPLRDDQVNRDLARWAPVEENADFFKSKAQEAADKLTRTKQAYDGLDPSMKAAYGQPLIVTLGQYAKDYADVFNLYRQATGQAWRGTDGVWRYPTRDPNTVVMTKGGRPTTGYGPPISEMSPYGKGYRYTTEAPTDWKRFQEDYQDEDKELQGDIRRSWETAARHAIAGSKQIYPEVGYVYEPPRTEKGLVQRGVEFGGRALMAPAAAAFGAMGMGVKGLEVAGDAIGAGVAMVKTGGEDVDERIKTPMAQEAGKAAAQHRAAVAAQKELEVKRQLLERGTMTVPAGPWWDPLNKEKRFQEGWAGVRPHLQSPETKEVAIPRTDLAPPPLHPPSIRLPERDATAPAEPASLAAPEFLDDAAPPEGMTLAVPGALGQSYKASPEWTEALAKAATQVGMTRKDIADAMSRGGPGELERMVGAVRKSKTLADQPGSADNADRVAAMYGLKSPAARQNLTRTLQIADAIARKGDTPLTKMAEMIPEFERVSAERAHQGWLSNAVEDSVDIMQGLAHMLYVVGGMSEQQVMADPNGRGLVNWLMVNAPPFASAYANSKELGKGMMYGMAAAAKYFYDNPSAVQYAPVSTVMTVLPAWNYFARMKIPANVPTFHLHQVSSKAFGIAEDLLRFVESASRAKIPGSVGDAIGGSVGFAADAARWASELGTPVRTEWTAETQKIIDEYRMARDAAQRRGVELTKQHELQTPDAPDEVLARDRVIEEMVRQNEAAGPGEPGAPATPAPEDPGPAGVKAYAEHITSNKPDAPVPPELLDPTAPVAGKLVDKARQQKIREDARHAVDAAHDAIQFARATTEAARRAAPDKAQHMVELAEKRWMIARIAAKKADKLRPDRDWGMELTYTPDQMVLRDQKGHFIRELPESDQHPYLDIKGETEKPPAPPLEDDKPPAPEETKASTEIEALKERGKEVAKTQVAILEQAKILANEGDLDGARRLVDDAQKLKGSLKLIDAYIEALELEGRVDVQYRGELPDGERPPLDATTPEPEPAPVTPGEFRDPSLEYAEDVLEPISDRPTGKGPPPPGEDTYPSIAVRADWAGASTDDVRAIILSKSPTTGSVVNPTTEPGALRRTYAYHFFTRAEKKAEAGDKAGALADLNVASAIYYDFDADGFLGENFYSNSIRQLRNELTGADGAPAPAAQSAPTHDDFADDYDWDLTPEDAALIRSGKNVDGTDLPPYGAAADDVAAQEAVASAIMDRVKDAILDGRFDEAKRDLDTTTALLMLDGPSGMKLDKGSPLVKRMNELYDLLGDIKHGPDIKAPDKDFEKWVRQQPEGPEVVKIDTAILRAHGNAALALWDDREAIMSVLWKRYMEQQLGAATAGVTGSPIGLAGRSWGTVGGAVGTIVQELIVDRGKSHRFLTPDAISLLLLHRIKRKVDPTLDVDQALVLLQEKFGFGGTAKVDLERALSSALGREREPFPGTVDIDEALRVFGDKRLDIMTRRVRNHVIDQLEAAKHWAKEDRPRPDAPEPWKVRRPEKRPAEEASADAAAAAAPKPPPERPVIEGDTVQFQGDDRTPSDVFWQLHNESGEATPVPGAARDFTLEEVDRVIAGLKEHADAVDPTGDWAAWMESIRPWYVKRWRKEIGIPTKPEVARGGMRPRPAPGGAVSHGTSQEIGTYLADWAEKRFDEKLRTTKGWNAFQRGLRRSQRGSEPVTSKAFGAASEVYGDAANVMDEVLKEAAGILWDIERRAETSWTAQSSWTDFRLEMMNRSANDRFFGAEKRQGNQAILDKIPPKLQSEGVAGDLRTAADEIWSRVQERIDADDLPSRDWMPAATRSDPFRFWANSRNDAAVVELRRVLAGVSRDPADIDTALGIIHSVAAGRGQTVSEMLAATGISISSTVTTPHTSSALGYWRHKTREVVLTEAQPMYVLIHEIGHFMFDTTEGQLRRDLTEWAMEKKLGDGEPPPLNHQMHGAPHERVAEAFSKYFLTETDPPTEALRPVMERYRRWAIDTYGSVENAVKAFTRQHYGLPDHEFNSIMRRMFRGDERPGVNQVAAAEARLQAAQLEHDKAGPLHGVTSSEAKAARAKLDAAKAEYEAAVKSARDREAAAKAASITEALEEPAVAAAKAANRSRATREVIARTEAVQTLFDSMLQQLIRETGDTSSAVATMIEIAKNVAARREIVQPTGEAAIMVQPGVYRHPGDYTPLPHDSDTWVRYTGSSQVDDARVRLWTDDLTGTYDLAQVDLGRVEVPEPTPPPPAPTGGKIKVRKQTRRSRQSEFDEEFYPDDAPPPFRETVNITDLMDEGLDRLEAEEAAAEGLRSKREYGLFKEIGRDLEGLLDDFDDDGAAAWSDKKVKSVRTLWEMSVRDNSDQVPVAGWTRVWSALEDDLGIQLRDPAEILGVKRKKPKPPVDLTPPEPTPPPRDPRAQLGELAGSAVDAMDAFDAAGRAPYTWAGLLDDERKLIAEQADEIRPLEEALPKAYESSEAAGDIVRDEIKSRKGAALDKFRGAVIHWVTRHDAARLAVARVIADEHPDARLWVKDPDKSGGITARLYYGSEKDDFIWVAGAFDVRRQRVYETPGSSKGDIQFRFDDKLTHVANEIADAYVESPWDRPGDGAVVPPPVARPQTPDDIPDEDWLPDDEFETIEHPPKPGEITRDPKGDAGPIPDRGKSVYEDGPSRIAVGAAGTLEEWAQPVLSGLHDDLPSIGYDYGMLGVPIELEELARRIEKGLEDGSIKAELEALAGDFTDGADVEVASQLERLERMPDELMRAADKAYREARLEGERTGGLPDWQPEEGLYESDRARLPKPIKQREKYPEYYYDPDKQGSLIPQEFFSDGPKFNRQLPNKPYDFQVQQWILPDEKNPNITRSAFSGGDGSGAGQQIGSPGAPRIQRRWLEIYRYDTMDRGPGMGKRRGRKPKDPKNVPVWEFRFPRKVEKKTIGADGKPKNKITIALDEDGKEIFDSLWLWEDAKGNVWRKQTGKGGIKTRQVEGLSLTEAVKREGLPRKEFQKDIWGLEDPIGPRGHLDKNMGSVFNTKYEEWSQWIDDVEKVHGGDLEGVVDGGKQAGKYGAEKTEAALTRETVRYYLDDKPGEGAVSWQPTRGFTIKSPETTTKAEADAARTAASPKGAAIKAATDKARKAAKRKATELELKEQAIKNAKVGLRKPRTTEGKKAIADATEALDRLDALNDVDNSTKSLKERIAELEKEASERAAGKAMEKAEKDAGKTKDDDKGHKTPAEMIREAAKDDPKAAVSMAKVWERAWKQLAVELARPDLRRKKLTRFSDLTKNQQKAYGTEAQKLLLDLWNKKRPGMSAKKLMASLRKDAKLYLEDRRKASGSDKGGVVLDDMANAMVDWLQTPSEPPKPPPTPRTGAGGGGGKKGGGDGDGEWPSFETFDPAMWERLEDYQKNALEQIEAKARKGDVHKASVMLQKLMKDSARKEMRRLFRERLVNLFVEKDGKTVVGKGAAQLFQDIVDGDPRYVPLAVTKGMSGDELSKAFMDAALEWLNASDIRGKAHDKALAALKSYARDLRRYKSVTDNIDKELYGFYGQMATSNDRLERVRSELGVGPKEEIMMSSLALSMHNWWAKARAATESADWWSRFATSVKSLLTSKNIMTAINNLVNDLMLTMMHRGSLFRAADFGRIAMALEYWRSGSSKDSIRSLAKTLGFDDFDDISGFIKDILEDTHLMDSDLRQELAMFNHGNFFGDGPYAGIADIISRWTGHKALTTGSEKTYAGLSNLIKIAEAYDNFKALKSDLADIRPGSDLIIYTHNDVRVHIRKLPDGSFEKVSKSGKATKLSDKEMRRIRSKAASLPALQRLLDYGAPFRPADMMRYLYTRPFASIPINAYSSWPLLAMDVPFLKKGLVTRTAELPGAIYITNDPVLLAKQAKRASKMVARRMMILGAAHAQMDGAEDIVNMLTAFMPDERFGLLLQATVDGDWPMVKDIRSWNLFEPTIGVLKAVELTLQKVLERGVISKALLGEKAGFEFKSGYAGAKQFAQLAKAATSPDAVRAAAKEWGFSNDAAEELVTATRASWEFKLRLMTGEYGAKSTDTLDIVMNRYRKTAQLVGNQMSQVMWEVFVEDDATSKLDERDVMRAMGSMLTGGTWMNAASAAFGELGEPSVDDSLGAMLKDKLYSASGRASYDVQPRSIREDGTALTVSEMFRLGMRAVRVFGEGPGRSGRMHTPEGLAASERWVTRFGRSARKDHLLPVYKKLNKLLSTMEHEHDTPLSIALKDAANDVSAFIAELDMSEGKKGIPNAALDRMRKKANKRLQELLSRAEAATGGKKPSASQVKILRRARALAVDVGSGIAAAEARKLQDIRRARKIVARRSKTVRKLRKQIDDMERNNELSLEDRKALRNLEAMQEEK